MASVTTKYGGLKPFLYSREIFIFVSSYVDIFGIHSIN